MSAASLLRPFLKRRLPAELKLRVKAWLDPEIATPRDLRFCYRLSLGRNPDREGWEAHMASIRSGAMTRARLVRTFLQSAEFRNHAALHAARHPDGQRVDLPDFIIHVRDTESAIGRAICEQRIYEPEVKAALETVLRPGMTFIDAGCNIGYFSLLAAGRVGESGRVLAFDPSPVNCRLLRRSAEENGFRNVEVPDADAIRRSVSAHSLKALFAYP